MQVVADVGVAAGVDDVLEGLDEGQPGGDGVHGLGVGGCVSVREGVCVGGVGGECVRVVEGV